jgi:lipopolysaccharide biosynthesis protein
MRRPSARGVRRRISQALGLGASILAVPPVPAIDTSPPSDFDRWLERRSNRLAASLPPKWLTRVSPEHDHARVAAVVHVYFPELLDEIITELESIPVQFDLIVTNATGSELTIDTSRLENLGRSTVLNVDNRGRDILPLVSVINADLLEPYELVLKVHTKRSDWREEHPYLHVNF